MSMRLIGLHLIGLIWRCGFQIPNQLVLRATATRVSVLYVLPSFKKHSLKLTRALVNTGINGAGGCPLISQQFNRG